jgi:flavin-dependent dehydrogenase
MDERVQYDVVIIGAGLAGLALTRQLLLESAVRILLLERRAVVPPRRQKVGEATVQVSGFYFSKVLELEEHLLREHFLKYNLRFYWKTDGLRNDCFEDYSQSYLRAFSNIPSYQLDRNRIEAEMLRLNASDPRCEFCPGVRALDVELRSGAPHLVSFDTGAGVRQVSATWVVDTSGRRRVLARQLELTRRNPIRHGASFLWVEGLVDLEKLTERPRHEIRRMAIRRHIGHSPFWLATNHFCGEGFWFWVIPLQGKTSLGLVYDNRLIRSSDVDTAGKLLDWACRTFPLFARDLPRRRVLDHSCFRDFSYGCERTISPDRWALSGEAGRFTDPLYSPGGDLIALHNTLIVDAVRSDAERLPSKCVWYERLMRAQYDAYVPSYAVSYEVLGDQDAMTLKYTWELAVYFSMYVFPFINDLLRDERFVATYLRVMARLGRINARLQEFFTAYYRWKVQRKAGGAEPAFRDFAESPNLQAAERTFYRVGISLDEARAVLTDQLANLEDLAQRIAAHVAAVVTGDDGMADDPEVIARIDPGSIRFGHDTFRAWSHSDAAPVAMA